METFPREIRLGVVMYGGVSLAVYINGVAAEFKEAVHGSDVYGLLKCLRQSEIVVDILSGASAGGINAILLGQSLTQRRTDAGRTSRLWRERGGIRDLLHPRGGGVPSSLFDGDGYYLDGLTEALEGDQASAPAPPTMSGRVESPVEALDLFVTGTDVQGHPFQISDALGSQIHGRDHRTVFRLRYRDGTRDDFGNAAALARLARLTSSFPGAFAPVSVALPAGWAEPEDEEPVDAALSRWANARRGDALHSGDRARRADFIDGGVLDNKPFTQTIEQIYYRLAHQPVDRLLFFVEPDPDVPGTPKGPVPTPDILGVIGASLVTLPRYESIAGDLRDIQKYNERVRAYWFLANMLETAAEPDATQKTLYEACRWRGLARLIPAVGELAVGPSGASIPAGRLEKAVDVQFSLRRLFFTTYRLYDELYRRRGPAVPEHGRDVLFALNRHIQLLKVVERRLETDAAFQRERRGARSADAIVRALRMELSVTADQASTLMEATARWSDDTYLSNDFLDENVVHAVAVPGGARASSIIEVVDEMTRRVLHANYEISTVRDVGVAYDNFARLDTYLYPLELEMGIREKDEIRLIRISARDAQLGYSRRPADRKLGGDAMGHFSGFLKRSWRANDILWGRLDARCRLIQALLEPKALRQVLESEVGARKVRGDLASLFSQRASPPAAIAEGERIDFIGGLRRLFPGASDADIDSLAGWLDRLTSPGDERRKALDELSPAVDPRSGWVTETLVRLAQTVVVTDELPRVIHDAKREAEDWGQPAFARIESLESAMSGNQEGPAIGTDAFEELYQVGAERLTRDIPPRVMVGLFARAALILRDAIFGAADVRAKNGGKSRFLQRPLAMTRKVLGGPLHVAHWYATVTRLRGVRLGLALVATVLFAVLLREGRSVIGWYDQHQVWRFDRTGLGIFVGLPALVLGSELFYGWVSRPSRGLQASLWKLVVMLVVAASIGVTAWGARSGAYDGLTAWIRDLLEERDQLVFAAAPLIGLALLSAIRSRRRRV